MFESWYLLIFFVVSRGASRCSHEAKLAHGLMDRDQRNKFLIPINSWILLIFNFFPHSCIYCNIQYDHLDSTSSLGCF